MHPIVVPHISQDQFSRYLKQVANDFGLDLPAGNKSEYTAYGITISWNYNPDTENCIIQCVHKPWWLPERDLDSRIEEEIKKVQTAPA